MKLDHLALAVHSIEKTKKIYEDLGLNFSSKLEVVASQGVTTAFAELGDGSHLELLEPLAGVEGPIQKFLSERKEGIHHLCFQVSDIKSKQQELEQKGYRFIYPQPVSGSRNTLVNFCHPKSTGGVLIELCQHPEKH